jgi:hypothetical protein
MCVLLVVPALVPHRFLCTFGWEWSADLAGEKAAGGLASLRRFTADLEAAQLNADELGEVPEEFLDPITMELMEVRAHRLRSGPIRADDLS